MYLLAMIFQYFWQNVLYYLFVPHACFYYWVFGDQRWDWFCLWINLVWNKNGMYGGRTPEAEVSTHSSIHSSIHLVIYSFNKYSLSSYHICGSVLGPGDISINNADTLLSETSNQWERATIVHNLIGYHGNFRLWSILWRQGRALALKVFPHW